MSDADSRPVLELPPARPPDSRGGPISVIYLAGSSYPAGRHVERGLADCMRGTIRRFLTQRSVIERCGPAALSNDIAERMAAVGPLVAELKAAGERVVIAGRSSGARAATRYAAEGGATAPVGVVCVGYPFRLPRGPDDPDRYAHLADLSVPTLILHGRRDPYGAPEVVAGYPLSPAIDLRWCDTDHEFHVTPDAWAGINATVLAFLRALP